MPAQTPYFKYTIVRSEPGADVRSFTADVNAFLATGWSLWGDPVVWEGCLVQALTRPFPAGGSDDR